MKGSSMFQMIWPDVRRVTEKQVRSWLADAIANEEVDDVGFPINPDTCDILDALLLLNDTGKFTFVPTDDLTSAEHHV